MPPAIEVLVVSANGRLQSVFSRLLGRQSDIVYQGGYPTEKDALALLDLKIPDVIISDMPPAGLDEVLIWREIRQRGPRLLMLTSYMREADIVRSVISGASGLILTPSRTYLLKVIHSIAQGQSHVPREFTALLRRLVTGEMPSRLDEEERAALGLIASGWSDSEIALEMKITPGEVRGCVISLLQKLL